MKRNREAEMQRRHADDKPDLARFEPSPASLSRRAMDWSRGPTGLLWAGTICVMLGALYLIQGSMLPGYLFTIVGALCVKAVHDA
jgi:uncharacterized membrane protein